MKYNLIERLSRFTKYSTREHITNTKKVRLIGLLEVNAQGYTCRTYSKTPQGDHPSNAGTPLRRPLGIGTMSGRLSGVLLYMYVVQCKWNRRNSSYFDLTPILS